MNQPIFADGNISNQRTRSLMRDDVSISRITLWLPLKVRVKHLTNHRSITLPFRDSYLSPQQLAPHLKHGNLLKLRKDKRRRGSRPSPHSLLLVTLVSLHSPNI